jgi:hypothetical protein
LNDRFDGDKTVIEKYHYDKTILALHTIALTDGQGAVIAKKCLRELGE